MHGTVQYCAPEALLDKEAKATTAMDVFSLGRILQWLSGKKRIFWPRLSERATDDDKMAYLRREGEIEVLKSDVDNLVTRGLVRELILKNPLDRPTVTEILVIANS